MTSNAASELDNHKHEILWFVARGQLLKGPYTTDELQNRVRKKEVSFLDYCWRQGFREWRPIGSIDNFDRRGRLRALPEYPSIECPGGGSIPAARTGEQKVQVERRDPNKKFQVTLARSRRHSITIYEWGFAAIFGIVFAFFAVQFALNEVEHAVLAKLSLLKAGIEVNMAAKDGDGVSPRFWQPLLSAPSFEDFTHKGAYDLPLNQPALVDLSVKIQGTINTDMSGGTKIDGYAVNEMPQWVRSRYLDENVDPVYVRPRQVSGRLPLRAPASIKVEGVGEPYLHE